VAISTMDASRPWLMPLVKQDWSFNQWQQV
jgi:hypothetical protein